MPGLDWTDPWVIGVLAGVGGVLALVGVTCSSSSRRRLRAAAVVAGFFGVAGLATAAGICIHALAGLRKPPAKAPRPDVPSAQDVLELFRNADPDSRLAMVRRLPEGEQGWHTVAHGDITQTVVAPGSLEWCLETEVVCKVRGRDRHKPVTTIKWVNPVVTALETQRGGLLFPLVKKGDLLLELDDTPLREELRERKATLEQKLAALTRAEKERATGAGTGRADASTAATRAALDAEIKRIRELKEDIPRCKIVAPHGGAPFRAPEQNESGSRAEKTIVAPGKPVREGQQLIRLTDLSSRQVTVRLPEAQVSRVRPGQEVRVRIDNFPDRQLTGRVIQVAPVAAPKDRLPNGGNVFPAVIGLEGNASDLKRGLVAEVVITTERRTGVLRVPTTALLLRGANRWSCYARGNERIVERTVFLGVSDGNFVEIIEGLQEGESVIADPRLLA